MDLKLIFVYMNHMHYVRIFNSLDRCMFNVKIAAYAMLQKTFLLSISGFKWMDRRKIDTFQGEKMKISVHTPELILC